MIVTIHNRKGGVGKTTTAINLAVNLALASQEVLLIDGDHQHNASLGLGCRARPATYDWLVYQKFLPEKVRPTLDLLPTAAAPSTQDAAWIANSRQNTVSKRLASLPHYDWIIVDTAPSESVWVNSLLACSDAILIPVDFSLYSIQGLTELIETLDRKRIIGLVPVRYDLRNRRSVELLEVLKSSGGNLVAPPIRVGVDVDRAAQNGLGMIEFASHSGVARDYLNLTDWMVTQIGGKITHP